MMLKHLFSSRQKWTKGAPARRADGKRTDPRKPDAVRFCLLGGLGKCYTDKTFDRAVMKLAKVIDPKVNSVKMAHIAIVTYNETQKFDAIKAKVVEAGV